MRKATEEIFSLFRNVFSGECGGVKRHCQQAEGGDASPLLAADAALPGLLCLVLDCPACETGTHICVSRKGPWRWLRDQSVREEAEKAGTAHPGGILSMCMNTWWGGSKDNRARLCSVVTSGRVMGTIPHRSKRNIFFVCFFFVFCLVGGWSKAVTGCPEGLWSLEIVKTCLDVVLSIPLGVGVGLAGVYRCLPDSAVPWSCGTGALCSGTDWDVNVHTAFCSHRA